MYHSKQTVDTYEISIIDFPTEVREGNVYVWCTETSEIMFYYGRLCSQQNNREEVVRAESCRGGVQKGDLFYCVVFVH